MDLPRRGSTIPTSPLDMDKQFCGIVTECIIRNLDKAIWLRPPGQLDFGKSLNLAKTLTRER